MCTITTTPAPATPFPWTDIKGPLNLEFKSARFLYQDWLKGEEAVKEARRVLAEGHADLYQRYCYRIEGDQVIIAANWKVFH